jgi:hypothetical protein
LTPAAETPNLNENVVDDDGLVEGEEDDEDDRPWTPDMRDVADEYKEQIVEMLENYIESHGKEVAEADGAQRQHREQHSDLDEVYLGGGDATDSSPR